MKLISYTQFKKDFKDRKLTAINICPYTELELRCMGTIYLSDAINEITTVTYKRKPTATLIPNKGDVVASLTPHYKLLTKLIRVDAQSISVFDENGYKLATIDKPIK